LTARFAEWLNVFKLAVIDTTVCVVTAVVVIVNNPELAPAGTVMFNDVSR